MLPLRRPPAIRILARRFADNHKKFNADNLIPDRPTTWLTRKIQESPKNRERFLKFASIIGMGSPRSLAQTRTFVLYERVCALRADEEKLFWRNDCALPPTFQSWFTVITLHIWMLVVRFRALPSAYSRRYADCLVEHFFQDVEDRVRAIMQPSHDFKPYTFISTFYVNPNAPKGSDNKEKLSNAPERLVSQQLKIFKEQWTGFSLSLDLALVKGDMEMAADHDPSAPTFRRAVNLVGGMVVNPEKVDFDKEAVTEDHSGVHDFPPSEADKYLEYPQLMLDIVQYIRRELVRLEAYSDEQIVDMDWRELKFGRVRESPESEAK
ncbi:hypothetical protein C8F01DRAFT_1243611 [Mycena amicta]|nr:hypothetical protein C8F01DRAFT_1243611 [Mycena amicta]